MNVAHLEATCGTCHQRLGVSGFMDLAHLAGNTQTHAVSRLVLQSITDHVHLVPEFLLAAHTVVMMRAGLPSDSLFGRVFLDRVAVQ